jgi:hypothetical protein
MCRAIFICVTLVAGIAAFPRPAAEQRAKDIIEDAIAAQGGMDKLKKYPGSQSIMKGTMSFMGQDVPIEIDATYFFPDMAKYIIKMELLGQKVVVEEIWNAGKTKITAGGMVVPLNEAQQAAMDDTMRMQEALELYPLLDAKKFEISKIDKPENANGQETVGVLVKTKGGKDRKLFFDAKTYALVMYEHRGLDLEEKEVDQKTVVLEHKKIDGILEPVKLEVLNDGKKFMTMKVTSVKHLEKIDKKEFDIAD